MLPADLGLWLKYISSRDYSIASDEDIPSWALTIDILSLGSLDDYLFDLSDNYDLLDNCLLILWGVYFLINTFSDIYFIKGIVSRTNYFVSTFIFFFLKLILWENYPISLYLNLNTRGYYFILYIYFYCSFYLSFSLKLSSDCLDYTVVLGKAITSPSFLYFLTLNLLSFNCFYTKKDLECFLE